MYLVYALYNRKHDKIYIGQTKNTEERLRLHNARAFSESYTSRFDGQWSIIYTESVPDRRSALTREKELKSYQGRQFIKKQIPR